VELLGAESTKKMAEVHGNRTHKRYYEISYLLSMGKNHTINHITKSPMIAIRFSADSGEFTIEVCLEG